MNARQDWTKPAAYIGHIVRDSRGRAIGYREPGSMAAALRCQRLTARYDRRPA